MRTGFRSACSSIPASSSAPLQPQHPLCGVTKNAIDGLRLKGRRLYVAPQNLVELWVVATRPAGENGLLPETEDIFPAWERLMIAYEVSGKPAHDARLVAAMHVHGVTSILTFDKTGFTRYGGIEVGHPAAVAA